MSVDVVILRDLKGNGLENFITNRVKLGELACRKKYLTIHATNYKGTKMQMEIQCRLVTMDNFMTFLANYNGSRGAYKERSLELAEELRERLEAYIPSTVVTLEEYKSAKEHPWK